VLDLVKELARSLGVPYTLIPAPDVNDVIKHVKNRTADIGFMAFDETRPQEGDFARAFDLMYSSFIVRSDSPIQKKADADRSGLQIGAVRGNSQELFLTENVKSAHVKVFETMPPQAELERLLVSGEIDAFGVNRQLALDSSAHSSKHRALPDSFLEVEQAFVVDKGNTAKVDAINQFVNEVRASG